MILAASIDSIIGDMRHEARTLERNGNHGPAITLQKRIDELWAELRRARATDPADLTDELRRAWSVGEFGKMAMEEVGPYVSQGGEPYLANGVFLVTPDDSACPDWFEMDDNETGIHVRFTLRSLNDGVATYTAEIEG